MFRSIWSRRRTSRGRRPARTVFPVADALEQRRLLSSGAAASPVVPPPAPANGQLAPAHVDLGEALKNDPTVATVQWAGHEALAKKGEWVAHFRGVRGTPAQQLAAVRSLLRFAPPGIAVQRTLGSDGLVLLTAPDAATYDQLRGVLRRAPGFDYVEPNTVEFQPAAVPNDPYYFYQ